MNAIPLRFFCRAIGARFLSDATCNKRHKGQWGVNLPQDQPFYEACTVCKGPECLSDKLSILPIEILPQKFRPKRPKPSITAPIAPRVRPFQEKRKPASKKKPKHRGTVMPAFSKLKPEGLWTGTTCGHTLPRSEFYRPQLCRPCLKASKDAYRRKMGQKVRQASQKPKPMRHDLHLMAVGQQCILDARDGRTPRGMMSSVRSEASWLRIKSGMEFSVEMVGLRVRVRRQK